MQIIDLREDLKEGVGILEWEFDWVFELGFGWELVVSRFEVVWGVFMGSPLILELIEV